MNLMNLPTVPPKRNASAASFRLPLGEVVCPCYVCGRPVHKAQLTFRWYEHTIRWMHRGCRPRETT